jgi:hypothetical protein
MMGIGIEQFFQSFLLGHSYAFSRVTRPILPPLNSSRTVLPVLS